MSSTLLLTLGIVGIFLALAILLGTIGTLTNERQQVGRSLAAVRAIQTLPDAPSHHPTSQPFNERVLVPLVGYGSTVGRKLTPSGQLTHIQRRLNLAGSPAGWDVDRIVAFKVLGLLAGLITGLIVSTGFGFGLIIAMFATAGLTLLGFYSPDLALYQTGYNRKERLLRELPDALDLLSISVEAGLAFDAALAQVARNTTGPLASEFFRVLQEMQIGLGRMEALRALGERTDLAELRGFVTAMVQADQFGIPIANVLRVQAREQRTKRSQRAEEAAQKVPVKILFPLIFCILPTLFIIVIGPAGIQIYHTFNQ
jgi:tight adherence protein C